MTVIIEDFKKPNYRVSYDAILADLRDTIRSELTLEPMSGDLWWFRFGRGSIENTAKPVPEADGGDRRL
jgi:hypothetical protein